MKRFYFVIAGLFILVSIHGQTHFSTVWEGQNGLDHMNIYVIEAAINNINLVAGDEVAIYDGQYCVGRGTLTGSLEGDAYLPIQASFDDPETTDIIDGFTVGNFLSFKVWDASEGIEYTDSELVITYYSGQNVFERDGQSAVYVNSNLEIPDPEPVCYGEVIIIDAGTGYNSYSWSTGETTQSISITEPGIYSITVTKDNGYVSTNEINVNFIELPVVDLGADVTACEGETVTMDAGTHSSYLWNTGEITQTIDVTQSGTYSVTVANAEGCEGSDEIAVTFAALPTVDLGEDVTACEGETVTLDAGTHTSYLWSTGETTQTIDVTQSGTYSVTVTNAEGCEGTDEIAVTFAALPIVDLGEDVTACEGETVTLDAGTHTSYLWSTGETTQTIAVTQSGTYSVTVTNAEGCEGSDELAVTFAALPIVDLGDDITACEGETVTLDAGTHTSYLWSTGETSQTIDVNQSGTYSVTVTNAEGCEGTDEIAVTFAALPIVDLGEDVTACEGETVTLDAGTHSSYLWSTGETTQTIDVTQSGTYSVTVTNAEGCEGTDEIAVTFAALPIVDLGEDVTACEGETVTLDAG
ncbi:MAG: DUF642 domain-containing protein, partial [Bacteroidales bacterium]|nr:DUF642 domain-containing protein [Bacteroidales bacterium]